MSSTTEPTTPTARAAAARQIGDPRPGSTHSRASSQRLHVGDLERLEDLAALLGVDRNELMRQAAARILADPPAPGVVSAGRAYGQLGAKFIWIPGAGQAAGLRELAERLGVEGTALMRHAVRGRLDEAGRSEREAAFRSPFA